jgi:hypothetical protein
MPHGTAAGLSAIAAPALAGVNHALLLTTARLAPAGREQRVVIPAPAAGELVVFLAERRLLLWTLGGAPRRMLTLSPPRTAPRWSSVSLSSGRKDDSAPRGPVSPRRWYPCVSRDVQATFADSLLLTAGRPRPRGRRPGILVTPALEAACSWATAG